MTVDAERPISPYNSPSIIIEMYCIMRNMPDPMITYELFSRAIKKELNIDIIVNGIPAIKMI